VDPGGACGVAGTNFAGCILLNTALTTPGLPTSTNQFSLLAVAEHEIDEVLGLISGLFCTAPGAGNCFVDPPTPQDLFRYDGSGVRSYALNTQTSRGCTGAPVAIFSLNGTTNLKEFNNCDNGGDYGDWASNGSPASVQDAFATVGSSPSLTQSDPAVVGLDAIGYNLTVQAVPAPLTGLPAFLEVGAFFLFGAKLWKRNRKKGMVAVAPPGSRALGF
jgi:hypothetical protein